MSAATFHGIWRSTCLTCYRKDVQDTNVMAPKDMARAEANQRSNVLQAGLLDEVLPRVSCNHMNSKKEGKVLRVFSSGTSLFLAEQHFIEDIIDV